MKQFRRIFYLAAAVSAVLGGGCGEKSPVPPERVREFCGVKLGQVAADRRELREFPARRHGVSGMVEEFRTPLTFTVWRVDFVAPEWTPAAAEAAATRLWGARPRSGRCELPGSFVEVLPAYDRGPRGVRLRVTDRAAAARLPAESAAPEVGRRRRREQVRETILLLEEALEHFRTDVGRYPRDLYELPENLFARKNWRGPYCDAIPRDPWNAEYHYVPAADGRSCELFSGGENGAEKLR